LTPHDRLTAPGVIFYFHAVALAYAKPACVLARQTNLAKLVSNRLPGLTLPPKAQFVPHHSPHVADPMLTKAIWRPLKSHT
jgi:hypothetical protein